MIPSVRAALEDLQHGKFVILVDDEERENEGDLVIAAQYVTPEKINFMETWGRGLVCFVAPVERLVALGLRPMEKRNAPATSTNFYTLVDARATSTTGISARERSLTVSKLLDPNATADDFITPGHLNTLGAVDGGVLQRAGHTEGLVDMCRLAGLVGAGVLCEIKRPDGEMARLADLRAFAAEHDLRIVSIHDLIAHRWQEEKLVSMEVETSIPNAYGTWRIRYYESKLTGDGHVALIMGDIGPEDEVLVRVHSKCFTGDTLGSMRCDCRGQLEAAMARIAVEGKGVIVYLMQEGRGIGLKNKLRAYALQDRGSDTVEANERLGFKADLREYGIGVQILNDIGVRKMRILTNNPKKLAGLGGFGMEIVGREPVVVDPNAHNERYLQTKASKMGHMIESILHDH